MNFNQMTVPVSVLKSKFQTFEAPDLSEKDPGEGEEEEGPEGGEGGGTMRFAVLTKSSKGKAQLKRQLEIPTEYSFVSKVAILFFFSFFFWFFFGFFIVG